MPTATELAALLATLAPALERDAVTALTFTAAEVDVIAEGGVAKRRERMVEADRVIGAMWTTAPRDALWVAIQDDKHFPMVEGLVDEQLPGTTPEVKVLYQRVDLPWPIADRQWVIEILNNRSLASATSGAVWERAWVPSPARGAEAETPDAVWVTVNDGGWLLTDAFGGTFMVYHARSVVSGNLPNNLATTWSYASVEEMLNGVVDQARKLEGHYDGAHEPVFRPDGSVIPPW
jgi:hypothetical protein